MKSFRLLWVSSDRPKRTTGRASTDSAYSHYRFVYYIYRFVFANADIYLKCCTGLQPATALRTVPWSSP